VTSSGPDDVIYETHCGHRHTGEPTAIQALQVGRMAAATVARKAAAQTLQQMHLQMVPLQAPAFAAFVRTRRNQPRSATTS